jgi:steroid delta-isomerase-like uncharacterized protein
VTDDAGLELQGVDGLAERWVAAWTSEGAFAGCCTTDVGYEDPLAPRPTVGPAAIEDHAARLRAAFPDVRLEATAPPLQRGDHACFPWRLAGTHSEPIAVLPATNRFVTLHGLHYVELIDGRIRRARGFFDLYDGASQLGLLPERGGLGETALLFLRGFGLRL